MGKPYEKAFLGGTFDRLHQGHRELIDTASHFAQYVFVGVVTESLGVKLFKKKEYANKIQSYQKRISQVKKYAENFANDIEVQGLLDPWGPAPIDNTRNGILITSRETRKSRDIINKMRIKRNLIQLDGYTIPWIKDGKNRQISSTLLREEE